MTLPAGVVTPAPARGRCARHRTYTLASCPECVAALLASIPRPR